MGKSENKKHVRECGKWKRDGISLFRFPFVAFKSYYKLEDRKVLKLFACFEHLYRLKLSQQSDGHPSIQIEWNEEGCKSIEIKHQNRFNAVSTSVFLHLGSIVEH